MINTQQPEFDAETELKQKPAREQGRTRSTALAHARASVSDFTNRGDFSNNPANPFDCFLQPFKLCGVRNSDKSLDSETSAVGGDDVRFFEQ